MPNLLKRDFEVTTMLDRRYSKEITPSLDGSQTILMGWVHEIRDLGGIIFILLRGIFITEINGLLKILYDDYPTILFEGLSYNLAPFSIFNLIL